MPSKIPGRSGVEIYSVISMTTNEGQMLNKNTLESISFLNQGLGCYSLAQSRPILILHLTARRAATLLSTEATVSTPPASRRLRHMEDTPTALGRCKKARFPRNRQIWQHLSDQLITEAFIRDIFTSVVPTERQSLSRCWVLNRRCRLPIVPPVHRQDRLNCGCERGGDVDLQFNLEGSAG